MKLGEAAIVILSLVFVVFGTLFILRTGRYELTFFILAALLPWLEHWSRHRRR
ncbi:MAG: hypothetical protein FWD08_02285 [Alphaproteobacteria bacterium]|nr:hypothetical protein [Alphaproteobacteria bacterium]